MEEKNVNDLISTRKGFSTQTKWHNFSRGIHVASVKTIALTVLIFLVQIYSDPSPTPYSFNAFAATTLTGLHFAATTIMTRILKRHGYIQSSTLPVSDLMKYVLFANFSIVGMNVSLMWNSVGFYQVTPQL